MWQKIIAYVRELFLFAETMDKQRGDVRDLQHEVRQLTLNVRLLISEMEHLKTFESQEREKLELKLKLALSEARNQKQLPPSKNE